MGTALTVATLETLFTADVAKFDVAATKVEARRDGMAKKSTEVTVGADVKGAVAGMDRVETQAKRIVSAEVAAKIDADITQAERKTSDLRAELIVLDSQTVTPQVVADTTKAQAALDKTETQLRALKGARATIEVQADTSQAESALDDVAGAAGDAGEKGGADAGKGLAGGIIAALATIPIAGAIVGIGASIGEALLDGLQVEVRSDRLMAQTGLDSATVGKLARAAGEAYASNWGESIASNMDTARLAIQQGLLDPDATARDAESVIASLAGVSDIIGGDISRTSQAAATLMRSGLAKDSAAAFDIIVKGYQSGNDKAEDWLDTLIEYPSVLTKLGLTGAEMTGLISQGLAAGARNSDVAADALKEFQIRATDASTTSTAAYQAIGLNAQEMTAKIAAGGTGAKEGLDQVLDGLRAMEDPVARNAAAVGLFGTKAEDMGDALFAMDLSSATEQLGGVAGAAQSAMDALGDNAAGSIASAQRNIEVAADGIKGALAAAFGPQIEDWATTISENREGLMQFLLDLANGGIDLGRAIVEGVASGTEATGTFISGPLADLTDSLSSILFALDLIPGVNTGGASRSMKDLATNMRGVEEDASAFADALRTDLITNGLDPMQERLNEVGIPLVQQAALHDATTRLASEIDSVGFAADGSAMSLTGMGAQVDTSTEQGRLLDEQLRAVAASMEEQARTGALAGQSTDELTVAAQASRDALVNQLVQMGLTQEQAEALATAYGAIPSDITTTVSSDTRQAQALIDGFITSNTGRKIDLSVGASGQVQYKVDGGTMKFYANGGHVLPMASGGALTPMSAVGQKVPPNTWRVVGDNLRVPEWYIPQDGSANSRQLVADAARAFGILPMAGGGVLNGRADAGTTVSLSGVRIVVQVGEDELMAVVNNRASNVFATRLSALGS